MSTDLTGPHETSISPAVQRSNERPILRIKKRFRAKERGSNIAFWRYCQRTAAGARCRSKKAGLPCDIDAHYLNQMRVDQEFRCAVTGIPFDPPSSDSRPYHQSPFGPSLDRQVPLKGYVHGNVRFTCSIVNMAMNEWGEIALLKLVAAMEGAGDRLTFELRNGA